MTYEYTCQQGHVFERYRVPVKEIEEGQAVFCPECGSSSFPNVTVPVGFGLYGNAAGYYKPSATKRHSTKLVNKDGNPRG